MSAGQASVIPRSRKYKKDEVYWWVNLYDKASLEMGADDLKLVLKFRKEAGVVGILVVGDAELFQKAHDLQMEHNLLSDTIVYLYCRQNIRERAW